MPSLDDPFTKVTWAGNHLEKMRLEYRRVMIDEPHFAVGELDAEHAEYVYRFKEPTTELDAFGLIVGDIVHNLRCALDQTAWQLAGIVGQQRREVMYPIFTTREGFDQAKKERISMLSQPMQDVIEGTQPYHNGYELLGLLHRLSIIDKHRVIPTVVRRYGGFGFIGRGDIDWTQYTMRVSSSPFHDGQEIMRLPFAVYAAHLEQEPTLGFSIELTEAEGLAQRGVYDVMLALHELVRDRVLPRFTQFFP